MGKGKKQYVVWDVEKGRPVFPDVKTDYRNGALAADALENELGRPIMVLAL